MDGLSELFGGTGATPALVSMGAGLTVVLVIAALAAAMHSPVRTRTAGRLAALEMVDRTYERSVSPLHDRRVSSIPILEKLFRGHSWVDSTRETLGRAGVPLRVGEYLAMRALVVVITLALGFAIARMMGEAGMVRIAFALLGGGVGWFVLPIAVKMRFKRRQQQIETQLVELCDVMASMLQSGYGYVQALTATAEEVGPPLSAELQRLLDTVKLGGDIDDALDDLNERLGSRDFDMIASAISIQRRSGGNLSEILVGVAETIRQRQSFLREVRTLTSRERYTAIIVAAFPLVLVALLVWMSPDMYRLLFTDVIGRIMLISALVVDGIGFLIIRKLTQVEV